MILFLNKDDLFREKIQSVDMKCCFADYDGGCDYEKAATFMKRQFLSTPLLPAAAGGGRVEAALWRGITCCV
jgi:hypothetical protein